MEIILMDDREDIEYNLHFLDYEISEFLEKLKNHKKNVIENMTGEILQKYQTPFDDVISSLDKLEGSLWDYDDLIWRPYPDPDFVDEDTSVLPDYGEGNLEEFEI